MADPIEKQIGAILTLLADRDGRTAQLVSRTLVEIGRPAIPTLQQAATTAAPAIGTQLREIVAEIRQKGLVDRFRALALRGADMDLEEGAFLIAEFGHPDLSAASYRRDLDHIAGLLAKRLSAKADPDDVIDGMNLVLFNELGFRGNTENYYDPNNSYLNRVIDLRVGIPITLSVIFLLLSKRLGLPVSGVALPGHFVVKYEAEDFCRYLDCFNRGQKLSHEECLRYLRNAGHEIRDEYFLPAGVRGILIRILRNLIYAYNQQGDAARVRHLAHFIQILQSTVQE